MFVIRVLFAISTIILAFIIGIVVGNLLEKFDREASKYRTLLGAYAFSVILVGIFVTLWLVEKGAI